MHTPRVTMPPTSPMLSLLAPPRPTVLDGNPLNSCASYQTWARPSMWLWAWVCMVRVSSARPRPGSAGCWVWIETCQVTLRPPVTAPRLPTSLPSGMMRPVVGTCIARSTVSGVSRLRAPSWSSAPQRPQLPTAGSLTFAPHRRRTHRGSSTAARRRSSRGRRAPDGQHRRPGTRREASPRCPSPSSGRARG